MVFNGTAKFKESDLKDCTRVKVAGIDIDGVLRGKIMSINKFWSLVKSNSGFGFCNVIFGWDLHDQVYSVPTKYSNSENGYKDLIAKIDLDSYRRLPLEDNIPFFFVDFYVSEEERLPICPRGLLKTMCNKLDALGYIPYSGAEFEYYNFSETPKSLSEHSSKPEALTPGMFGYSLLRTQANKDYFTDIFEICGQAGIPLEGHHTETGPGVYESALEFCPTVEMGDRGVLFKTMVKHIGLKHKVMPTFMAKPYPDLPGCSGHMHLSLVNKKDKSNAFAGSSSDKNYSQIMEWFVAGLMEGLSSIMAIMAPTVNSYKRLNESFWAPVRVCWGEDNRLASVRLITPPSCSEKSTRIEIRTPGADCNATLVLAAILACGLYGIENKLTNPYESIGNYKDISEYPGPFLPKSLEDATNVMDAKDSIARKVLGEDFVDHYVATKRHELKLWKEAVTDWEIKRYFELI